MGGSTAAKPQRAVGKPASSTNSTPPTAPVVEESSAPPASAPPAAKRGRKPKADNKLTKAAAWESLETAATGKADANKVAEAWLSACAKIDKDDEDKFTEEDWFTVNKEAFVILGL